MTESDNEIAASRARIDALDDQILNLLNERASCNADIGKLKATSGSTSFVPGRELEIFERLEEKNPGPFPVNAIRNVFRCRMSSAMVTVYASSGPNRMAASMTRSSNSARDSWSMR